MSCSAASTATPPAITRRLSSRSGWDVQQVGCYLRYTVVTSTESRRQPLTQIGSHSRDERPLSRRNTYTTGRIGSGRPYFPLTQFCKGRNMSVAHIEIRRLVQENAADAALYRDIRLEALRANPEAFGSTFEIENALSLSWFFDRLGTSTVFGAFPNTELVGIAGFEIQQGQKRA